MEGIGLETPCRKRTRSGTPLSHSSSRHLNKRFRTDDILASPSPQNVRTRHLPLEEDPDTVMESDVPESPIAARKSLLSASFETIEPSTPSGELDDPFAKLNLKSSSGKKGLATPVAVKTGDGNKSVKKSVRKTPGHPKTPKSLPFRINVRHSTLLTRVVLIAVLFDVID